MRQLRPDRMMWVAGLVLAVAVFAGLVLNLTTGLTRTSWIATLAVAVLVCGGVFLGIRRRRGTGAEAGTVRKQRISLLAAGYLLLAAALAGSAVWLAAASAGWRHTPGFAQLWLVPGSGSATLGVRNEYPRSERFRLVLSYRSGTARTTWNLDLAAGEAWQRTVPVPAGSAVTARLSTPSQVLEVAS